MKERIKSKALEELIKKNFCNSKVAKSVVGCAYLNRKWCPRNCKYACGVDNKNYVPPIIAVGEQ